MVRLFVISHNITRQLINSSSTIHWFSLCVSLHTQCQINHRSFPSACVCSQHEVCVCVCVCVCTCFYTSFALSVLFSRHARLWTNNVLFMAQSLCAYTLEHRDVCLCVWWDTTQPSPLSVYCFSPCHFFPRVLYLAHKKKNNFRHKIMSMCVK